jgi:hypothetical protein
VVKRRKRRPVISEHWEHSLDGESIYHDKGAAEAGAGARVPDSMRLREARPSRMLKNSSTRSHHVQIYSRDLSLAGRFGKAHLTVSSDIMKKSFSATC